MISFFVIVVLGWLLPELKSMDGMW
jgi:hypothetical protein